MNSGDCAVSNWLCVHVVLYAQQMEWIMDQLNSGPRPSNLMVSGGLDSQHGNVDTLRLHTLLQSNTLL